MESGSVTPSPSSLLDRSWSARLPDRLLRLILTLLAALILVLIVYFFVRLIGQSRPALASAGLFHFVFDKTWIVNTINPSLSHFGAFSFVIGTLVTSAVALLIGVPVAVATAIYLTELCPRRLRTPVTAVIELLAAVPSIVYGLWGLIVLAPALEGTETWVAAKLSFVPFVGSGIVTQENYFVAGLVLAIMILPIVSAISREVLSTVPADHKEAALALGATRWEMIRMAVLPPSRAGITSAAMLGLGRALGETIAVALLIGNATQLGTHLFGTGNTLAANIINNFGEAQGTGRSGLFGLALVLFVLTLFVNGAARLIVLRTSRGTRVRTGDAASAVGAAA
jgi:phosphate ABC transporter permease protein PstC